MNKVLLIGRLTADPKKIEANEKVLCKFGFATPEDYTKDGQRATTFHTIVCWNKTAENCLKYLQKGSQVSIVGKIQYRKWQDEKGEEKYATEIIAEEVEFVSGIKKSEKDDELY